MLAALKAFVTLSKYGVAIVPCARREIRKWAAAASGIPDPMLRTHATQAILVDGRNAEAVAALAATAPRRQRRITVELLVAYQILVDYVDTVGERVCADDLGRSVAFGMALVAAIETPASPLRLDPLGDDGGYLGALVTACRGRLWRLPSALDVERQATVAAVRCAHALAFTHAAAVSGTTDELRDWTETEAPSAGYSWWEIAAGGNSSIAILALLAAAADPLNALDTAAALATAYWPHLCVMSTMLDSLVDYERDAASGDFSFVAHYPDRAAVRCGLVRAAQHSVMAASKLRHSHTHTMIVCGVAGYYAASAAPGGLAAEIAPSVLATLGPRAVPIVLALRARHRIGARRRRRVTCRSSRRTPATPAG